MGITVGIFGMSGDGKTTSTIINKDGSYKYLTPEYILIVSKLIDLIVGVLAANSIAFLITSISDVSV